LLLLPSPSFTDFRRSVLGIFLYRGVRMDDLTACYTRASLVHMNERRRLLDLVTGAQSTQTDQCIVLGPQV
jgi:hypothetical protein